MSIGAERPKGAGQVMRWFRVALLLAAAWAVQAQSPPEPALPAKPASPPLKAETAPLQLDPAVFPLPSTQPGKPYSHQVKASGGVFPYHYDLASGHLPGGLTLTPNGMIQGEPVHKERAKFTIRVTDTESQTARQTYTLNITTPRPPRKPKPDAPATLDPYGQTLLAFNQMRIYRLLPAILEALAKELQEEDAGTQAGTATEDSPSGDPVPPDEMKKQRRLAQLKEILTPLFGVEYPTRILFEHALDYRLITFVQDLARTKLPPPTQAQLDTIIPPDWTALAKAGARKADGAGGEDTSLLGADLGAGMETTPLAQVPAAIMPLALRNWIVGQAAQVQALNYTLPIQWTGNNCGTSLDSLTREIYGFYPTWLAKGKPQTLDFSLLTRLSLFALAVDGNGHLVQPDAWAKRQTDFIRVADQHHTALDITLYRGDWSFFAASRKGKSSTILRGVDAPLLDVQPSEKQTRISSNIFEFANNASKEAVALLNQPLQDFRSRVKASFPILGRPTHFGRGLTLWFDEPVDPEQRYYFPFFFKVMIAAMAKAINERGNDVVLNIVIPDHSFNQPNGAFELPQLFELILKHEKPVLDGETGRIKDSSAYKSTTHVTLRFLVPLSEPTTDTKKRLRQHIESADSLQGSNRRIFLEKIIPVLMSGGTDPTQFEDDLAYCADNFGGVGFWPIPIAGESSPEAFSQVLWDNLHQPGARLPNAFARWIAEHRWSFRILFNGLVFLELLALACYFLDWRLRELGRPVQLGLILGGLVTAFVGGLLLNFDPDLAALKRGNSLLWLFICGLALSALFQVLRPTVEKP